MALVNAENKKRLAVFGRLLRERSRRRALQQSIIISFLRRRIVLKAFLLILLLLLYDKVVVQPRREARRRQRTCRRLPRNTGWWNNVKDHYSNARFKKTFRVSRETFSFILERVKHDIEKKSLTEKPIPAEIHLAVCLYRLGRGDYLYTISELTGFAVATVCQIVNEVSAAIVNNLWDETVTCLFPRTTQDFRNCMEEMESEWQFPYCFGAFDGSHIPIKCPHGGAEACKEFHNFKNFYSTVIMALVDSKYRFIWVSAGFPGNSHDAVILKSTKLYSSLASSQIIPHIAQNVDGSEIAPLLLGDGAFPFHTWLMKPYSNAYLTPQQRYFNYRLSGARMVTEGAFGQLKGRWRILLRKCESRPENVKVFTLACVVLHNLCIRCQDVAPRQWDLTKDPSSNKRRDQSEVRKLLLMRNCRTVTDNNRNATKIRETLKDKFWREKIDITN
ncbi:uncharacterized protein LOC135695493 [Rhopilema esculentum]|uniref:uncharacterized protein LOC135695493 n=1 Tax=Rhopilema esculentum TaxID=499914 RepID=UPI0031D22A6D